MSIPVDYVEIGSKWVGAGFPVYIVAEAGSNHNGDLGLAKKLVEAAAEAGADAVKFQAFRASEHYSKLTPGFTYLEAQWSKVSTYELVSSLEINRDWHPLLMEHANACGITFLSSPCDRDAIVQLADLGMPAFKAASFDLPDLDIIRFMAQYGRPLILSTGLADYADIERALCAAREGGNKQVVLLQCTSLYPAPAKISNLSAMSTMRQAFKVPVGYSDHTKGDHICLAAVALGACMIEKHFTIDQSLPGPDHSFAIEPKELKNMVARIREVESAIGDGIKAGPRAEEMEMYEKGRRSLHVRRAIKAGEVIKKSDLCAKRPGYGVPPYLREVVVGMVARRDIQEDRWIRWEDLK